MVRKQQMEMNLVALGRSYIETAVEKEKAVLRYHGLDEADLPNLHQDRH